MAGPQYNWNPDQAQQLLAGGHIGQGTYDSIMATQPPPPPAPLASPAPEPMMDVGLPPPPAEAVPAGGFMPPSPEEMEMEQARATQASFQNIGNQVDQTITPSLAALDTQRRGIDTLADEARKKGVQEANYLAGFEKEKMAIEQKRAEERLAEQVATDEAKAKYDSAITAVGDAKIDNERYFKNQSTPQKIMAAIGIALGGLGKGPNQALQAINDAVNRDIDEQKAGISGLKDKAAGYRTAFQDSMSITNNKDLAAVNAKIGAYERVSSQIAQLGAKYKGTEAALKAQMLGGQVDVAKQQLLGQRNDMILASARQQGLLGPQFMDEKDRERFVPGYGLALDPDSAKKMREVVSTTQQVKSGIGQLLKFADSPLSTLSPEDRAKTAVLAQEVIGNLRLEFLGPGAITDKERAVLEDIVRKPTNLWSLSSSNKAALQTLVGRVQSKVTERAKSYGLKPLLGSEKPN